MLHPFMKNGILSDINCGLTVGMDCDGQSWWCRKIVKKAYKPGAPPREIRNPLIDCRESRQDAQLASQKARRAKEGSEDKRIPWPGFVLRYRRTRSAAEKWESLGCCIYWLKIRTTK